MVADRSERGQVILIGAIALAFLILGVVVVFNGALYTETLASGSTSQSASSADVVENEVEQSIGCLLEQINRETDDSNAAGYAADNISVFDDAYRNTTAQSAPVVVTITETDTEVNEESNITHSNVTITYDSTELSYEQTRTIEPEPGCP
ncbi:hypothetical protein [Natrinema salifodinae]|uniref:Uncharacterized protein n=1 Tax=Natrinema salifodinae TaxID=1202768 RepID=A0A1I0N8I7_9EURY|nr:hypothetical protein [Natrinema salifodinae]SEV97214.1 hypothetical protein SAMN05216285_1427 [Natrinema salifodinae]